jgi:hypothetical protein
MTIENAGVDVFDRARATANCLVVRTPRRIAVSSATAFYRASGFSPMAQSGHLLQQRCPKSADFVAKVENRTTPKISRKLIFRELQRCARRYVGPWWLF